MLPDLVVLKSLSNISEFVCRFFHVSKNTLDLCVFHNFQLSSVANGAHMMVSASHTRR